MKQWYIKFLAVENCSNASFYLVSNSVLKWKCFKADMTMDCLTRTLQWNSMSVIPTPLCRLLCSIFLAYSLNVVVMRNCWFGRVIVMDIFHTLGLRLPEINGSSLVWLFETKREYIAKFTSNMKIQTVLI